MQKTVVIGAAGTGKTYLLVESVARLLEEEGLEAPGGKILILTSSPRAADDIGSRLKNARPDRCVDDAGRLVQAPEDAGKMPALPVVIHTVGSLCEEVLRDSDPELQILSDFRAWFILRECIRAGTMKSSYIRVKDKPSFIREVLELIEAASVNSISIDQLPGSDQAADKLEDTKGIYRYYKDFCERHNLLPAFDVISRALSLLSEYGEQFSHIFIDQYEDLCPGEIQTVKLLSGDHANVTIFMDAVRCDLDSVSNGSAGILPASSFHESPMNWATTLWPGNEIGNIKKLDTVEHAASLFPSAFHGRLSANMAGHVNRLLGKVMYSEAEGPSRTCCQLVPVGCGQDARAPGGNDQVLTIAVAETAVDEAEYMARTIKKESRRPGRKYADFAILCREVERHGRVIRDALKKYSIPCSGGVNVSQDPMVRFVLLCLRVVAEPREDDIVLKWLSSPIARLDRADVYRAYARARKKKQELLRTVAEEASLRASPLFHKSGDRLKELLSMLDFVRGELESGKNVWELVNPILVRSGAIDADKMVQAPEEEVPRAVTLFTEMIRDIEITYDHPHPNPPPSRGRELDSPPPGEGKYGGRKLAGLPVVLDDIKAGLTQISDPDKFICEDSDSVRITSIRESSGLEFPFVFIPGMVDNFFPVRHPARQLLHGEDLSTTRAALRGIDLPATMSPGKWREQERQLFYIAMTRAKEKLYLTFAHQYPENEDCEPSPFLVDLLGGKEISADNCDHYNILYQDDTVFSSPGELLSLDHIISRTDLEIACYRYVRELEQLDHQKAEEAIKLLSSTGAVGDLLPPVPLKEVAITQFPPSPFSCTSVRSFLSCPRRYFLAYLLKVEADYGAGALFGKLMHDVLKEFHKQYPKLCDYDLEELWKDVHKILFDVWDGKVEVKFPPLEKGGQGGFDAEFAHNRLQAQSYLKLAEEVLRAYLRAEHSRWEASRSCIRTERRFDFSFFDKYTLTGLIDRIDACAPGGDEIIDFKTSAYDKEAESALKSKFLNMDDDPNYRPQDYQLPIYYLAGLSDRALNPKKLVIYQLRNLSRSSGAPFRRELEILPHEDRRSGKKDKFLTVADLESVKDDILRTLGRMASGLYPPEPRDDNVCERECEFSFLCDREESDNQWDR